MNLHQEEMYYLVPRTELSDSKKRMLLEAALFFTAPL